MKVAGVLLLLVAHAVPGFAQAPDDTLIVPGQRIGKWTLETTLSQFLQVNGPRPVVSAVGLAREEVEKAYGQPTGRATFQGVTPTITLVYDGLGIATHIRDGVVQRIMVFRPGAGKQIWKF